jgi:hypothetical protein
MGAGGACTGVGTGVLCTTYGGLVGGVGVASVGAIRELVVLVGGNVNLTLWPLPVGIFL